MDKKWTTKDFPVGLFQMHPDVSVNFQMNRFYNWSNDETMREEMQAASPSIRSYEDLIASFTRLGNQALDRDEKLKAAPYFRGAEFFVPESNAQKQELRHRFLSLNNAYYGITDDQQYRIPYNSGYLSVYRFTPPSPQGTVVVCNGFDGYIEEFMRMLLVLKDAGYDTIAFDGPGQGTVLEECNMPMIPEWEKPVHTLLDYFKLNDVTLIGVSLGGCLALRAAAYEKRVKRVIAFDVLADFFEVLLRQMDDSLREKARYAVLHGRRLEINTAVDLMMKKSLVVEWGIRQGMHVMGSDSPYDFLHKTLSYNTAEISPLITQDVLLLAGQDDHYVPVHQLTEQISALTNVRSLTARMFTAKENAGSHCQLGNIGLAAEVILDWINQTAPADGLKPAPAISTIFPA
ncbi:alpha/beta hydrolase [Caproiciproducens sp. CPB-2]|uniref:alpha/beta hydrolase n=1 Tax=Caproiciproducens sp. CPB-2 TaxID=3030017 RepID=UPI0023DC1435|nr:alpha/beta fold hydrolase [Caproiciproducens sp. CPB-2]MDF1495235.1 alpha/beta fold hydrolase [Caproiciproducens sp. CPB-2]